MKRNIMKNIIFPYTKVLNTNQILAEIVLYAKWTQNPLKQFNQKILIANPGLIHDHCPFLHKSHLLILILLKAHLHHQHEHIKIITNRCDSVWFEIKLAEELFGQIIILALDYAFEELEIQDHEILGKQ